MLELERNNFWSASLPLPKAGETFSLRLARRKAEAIIFMLTETETEKERDYLCIL